MIEVAMVFGRDGAPLHWHLPDDRSRLFIPDSRTLWEVLWERRNELGSNSSPQSM